MSDWEDHDFEEFDEFHPPRRRGLVMRHPVLLAFVMLGSAFVAYKSYEKGAFYFAETTECGDLSERPFLKQKNPDQVPPLDHNTYCHLFGAVQVLNVFATPKKDGRQPGVGPDGPVIDSQSDLEDVRYYVKLAGENVFAILPADRKDVYRYRLRKNGLFGYNVDEVGRIIDPDEGHKYLKIGEYLRRQFGLATGTSIRIFDVNDHPKSHLGYLLISAAMVLTMLGAIFGLYRRFRNG